MLKNPKYKKIVVKIGTNVLTTPAGLLDKKIIQNIVYQIAKINQLDAKIVVVSSGAMGAGRSLIKLPEKTNQIIKRQVLASIGQIHLMQTYSAEFQKYTLHCAQVLATREDFRDRTHYLNMSNCFEALMKNNIIPIVNENDVISISELMFTDNDELAGLVASMINAEALIMLTSVNGIFQKNPDRLIKTVTAANLQKVISHITPQKSSFGRGGMLTKCHTAKKLANLGINTHIINGKTTNAILKVLNGEKIGTEFQSFKKASPLKRWIANARGQEKGSAYLNSCAVEILTSPQKTVSLLPVGIIKIAGDFQKGDLISIKNESGLEIGLGKAQYGSATAKKIIGRKNQKPLVHYDYLFIH